jgi:hypothetical protein
VNTALALTVGMARSWVALYTVRLPHETREARRSEIDSDLWEQQWLAAHRGDPAIGTAIEVLTRMLLGTISDITWRVQASAPARPDRGIKVNEALYMRGMVAVGVVVVVAFFFIMTTEIGAIVGALIMIPICIALVAIAFFRTRRPGAAVEIGSDRMGTEGKSRWKLLLVVMGASVATVVAMAAYAFSLEEWGEARALIFNLGGLIAMGAFSIALVLLISDLIGTLRRKTDN